ncbi:MAG TPA: hypothetical protein VFB38_08435, partial [Chthonomonadaceae bacterium]|nr:hypothetical protein [Chthonomonadaceae bacterium]
MSDTTTTERGHYTPPAFAPVEATPAGGEQAARKMRASWRVGLFVFLLGSVIAYVYAFLLYPRQGLIQPVIDLNGFGQLARHLAHG